MRVTVQDREVWIPDWRNNLDLPEEDRVSVEIEYPTTRSHGRMQSIIPKVSSEQGTSSTEVEVRLDHDRIITTCVKRIHNLETVNEEGTVVQIRTAEQLLNSRQLNDLRDDIAARIVGFKVEDEDRKKS